MATRDTAEHDRAELLAGLATSLCTRTLNQFAAESRQDGESLRDALDRYEIDYAWHVLGSDRLRDETVSLLQARLGQPATAVQQACIGDVLKLAAAEQSSEHLMSFDNDVAAGLVAILCAQRERKINFEALAQA
jgi:hypothetical protein